MQQNIDVKLTQRVLNGKTYFIGVTLFNPKLKYSFSIFNNMLLKLRIDNNLDSFFPTGSIIFQDIDGKYTNLYTHFGQYMKIVILPPQSSENNSSKTPNISLVFLVTEHKLIEYNVRKPKYKISGVLHYESSFNKHIIYATNKNYSKKSPYFLIKNILSNVGIDIKTQLPNCTQAIHFISDQNNTVMDAVKYCLMMGTSQNDPPAYLYYHIINDQFLIVNRDSLLKQPTYACNLDLVIPNEKGVEKIDNSLILYNIQAYSNIDSEYFYQTAALQDRWTYDQIQRKWVQTIIKPQKYQELLSFDNKKQKNIKTSFDIQAYQQTGIRLYATNFQYNLYARLHNLQIGSNCLQFYVEGNIIRDCGQIIKINCLDTNFANIYGGFWQTYSVTHIIQADRYSNIINTYRTFNNNFRQKN